MKQGTRLSALERSAVVVLGVYLAGVGINVLTRSSVMYSNYLRWPVAAPIALIVGVMLVVRGFQAASR